jgi:hypothetical protein
MAAASKMAEVMLTKKCASLLFSLPVENNEKLPE